MHPVSANAPLLFQRVLSLVLLAAGPLGTTVFAEDWPAHRKDVYRTGITGERLMLPLEQVWCKTTSRAPVPAWTESPAIHDYLHNHYHLKPRQHFDRCFDVAVVGNRVYYGSSVSGAVHCLDATDGGKTLWTFFTEGPVRFTPHVDGGRVYFGSDDGFVYCLDAVEGTLVWKHRAGPTDEKIWGNEHMISIWPVRTSVTVADGEVYWTAGLFPGEGMFLCKRRARDGSGGWTTTPVRPHQGHLALTADWVIAPSGKSFAAVYQRKDGSSAGDLKKSGRDGGCWTLVTPDESQLWTGPSVENATRHFKTSGRTFIALVGGANTLVANTSFAFYNTDTSILKIEGKKHGLVWRQDLRYPHALIKAKDHLFAGGDREVASLDANTGKILWNAEVDGSVYGLAAANGALYVSTDRGSIYCFGAPQKP